MGNITGNRPDIKRLATYKLPVDLSSSDTLSLNNGSDDKRWHVVSLSIGWSSKDALPVGVLATVSAGGGNRVAIVTPPSGTYDVDLSEGDIAVDPGVSLTMALPNNQAAVLGSATMQIAYYEESL